MIGQIVLGLLAAVYFSCMSTEANLDGLTLPTLPSLPTLPAPFPTFDPNVLSACTNYTPKASFANITGFAYVDEFSASLDCLSLNIQPIAPGLIYTSTNSYNNNGSPVSSMPSTLILNPLQPGQAQSLLPNLNGTLELKRTVAIVGFVRDDSGTGFLGYTLVSCGIDGSKQMAIVVKNKPPQNDTVQKLTDQLKDNSLQGVQLKEIIHGDNCTYPTPSNGIVNI